MNETLKRLLLGSPEQTYTYLLLSLTLFVTVTPFLPRATRLAWISDYMLVLVLMSAARHIAHRPRYVWIGAALGLPAVVARLFHAHLGEMSLTGAAFVSLSTAAFFCFLIWLVMDDVYRGQRDVGEKVMGAIVAYLLIGLLWTLVYGLIELLEPASFAIPEAVAAWVSSRPNETPFSIFLYHSFVTLSTLGYGDITPISNAARTFSWFEAVVGQLFIAVTIARLVGIHASRLSSESSSSPKEPES
jgi:voltage-gated potassium channel